MNEKLKSLSDVILRIDAGGEHCYRCYGRELNMCPMCNLRFDCWTTFRGRYGIRGLIETQDAVMHIGAMTVGENATKTRSKFIVQAMFDIVDGFEFAPSSDTFYNGKIFLEGAFKCLD